MNTSVFNSTGKFLDPEKVLFEAGLNKTQTVVDLGTGSGFYAIAASKIVGSQGRVYVVDILDNVLAHVASEARLKGLRNIQTLRCDLELPNACDTIQDSVADLIIFANVTHEISNKDAMFTEAYRMLKTGGKLLVVEWNATPSPIGPRSEDRISEQDVLDLTSKKNFKLIRHLETDRYHYGLLLFK